MGTADEVTGAGRAGLWLWDVLFAVAAAGTAVLVATGGHPGLAARVGAIVLVLGTAAAWMLLGRRLAVAAVPRGGALYAAGLVVALTGAVVLAPEANWAAFVVVPQLFWLLPLRTAIVATIVLTPLWPGLASLAHAGDSTFTDFLPQILFMTVFGVVIGIYIHRVTTESTERARLIDELEASRATVAQLSHDAGVNAERERLAGEIHDTLAQGITSIVTLLQAAQVELDTDPPAARRHLDLAVRAARENLQEARHLVAASAPGPLAHPLVDAIGRQVDRIAEEHGLDAEHGLHGRARRLPAEQEVVLLRATQELLANVGRHAGASTVTVQLAFRDTAVALTVADDGTGFDPGAVTPAAGGGGFGLGMMRSRVERLGGTFTLDTAPGAGTVAVLTLPAPDPSTRAAT